MSGRLRIVITKQPVDPHSFGDHSKVTVAGSIGPERRPSPPSSPAASLVRTDSSKLTSDSKHLDIYSSLVASLMRTDSSQLTSDSQHLGINSSLVASLVLTDSSQLTSDSQHLGINSSPVASLVLTDSSQLTSDSQHLVIMTMTVFQPAALDELRRWTSLEAFGDVTVAPDCASRIAPSPEPAEETDHKLPSPEEQNSMVVPQKRLGEYSVKSLSGWKRYFVLPFMPSSGADFAVPPALITWLIIWAYCR
uniref:Uncharacterized protein n=1 Tax=Timema shepardi TaxID=629360 RepID=A0A7R9B2Q6_TIMSH|nr:unnamed protein product [Timema shepardi]